MCIRDSPAVVQMIQDGDGKGSPFRGIRARAQLIKEAEGVRIRMLQDGNDAGHMGRERAQTLFYALFIPDIRIDFGKNGQFRTVQGGNMQARLAHQAEKAGGFQGNRLASGIWACNDQKVIVLSEADINGNGLLLIQQGMSCACLLYTSNSVADGVQAYLTAGVPADKLVLGIPFYGYLYEGVSQENQGLYSTFTSARSIGYDSIRSSYLNQPGMRAGFHEGAAVPYLYGNQRFLSYEDVRSVAAKAAYAKQNGLAGIGVWELSQNADGTLLARCV